MTQKRWKDKQREIQKELQAESHIRWYKGKVNVGPNRAQRRSVEAQILHAKGRAKQAFKRAVQRGQAPSTKDEAQSIGYEKIMTLTNRALKES